MSTAALTPDQVNVILQKRYDSNRWSNWEKLLRNRSSWRNPYLAEREVSFTTAIHAMLHRSLFGTFLKCFNEQQNQNKFLNEIKLEILNWDIQRLSVRDLQNFVEKNSAMENVYFLLAEAVQRCDVIDWDFLYEKVRALRLNNFYINYLDKFPKKFKNLNVLILCANRLDDICGANLPKQLKFLELFANQIKDLRNLVKGLPKGLIYLGLGRNNLTDDNDPHLLLNSNKFAELRCLDLSDNDICDIDSVTQLLQCLGNLCSLQLEGNPCYVCESYKDVILKYLPKLLFLDNTEILIGDRLPVEDTELRKEKAAVVFTCHRILGLPPPPKEKGAIQTIHIEVSLPLLEEIVLEPEVVEDETAEETKKLNKKGKSKEKENGGSHGSKEENKKKDKKKESKSVKSLYASPDEYAEEVRNKVKNTAFKTARVPWSKIIQFPEDAIIVEHPEINFKEIRNTFRSNVNIKVVYLKVQLPNMKKMKKDKKGSKKGKDKKSGKSKKDKTETIPSIIEEVKEPEETILKKVTLANFYCDLHYVNWSDKTIDFYWANHPKANPNAIPVEGSLRDLYYGEDTGHRKSLTESTKKETLPNIFTCHVGFGLRRT